MDKTVVPNVKATAFSVSPPKLSENVDTSPAVGIAKAISTPKTISGVMIAVT